jgi:hypothetical protein
LSIRSRVSEDISDDMSSVPTSLLHTCWIY